MRRRASKIDRRAFVRCGLVSGLAHCWMSGARAGADKPAFTTRGVVLVPEDLSLDDWPDRAHKAGLTTIGLHHGLSPAEVVRAIGSDAGKKFLERCGKLGLQIEYELHAMGELLPRERFRKDPALFRMNDKGERSADANLCVHSRSALDLVGERALALAKALRPTTRRYFLWGDDGKPWCRCEKCREFSDSDQALLLENHLVQVLRGEDAKAELAHLAYANTMAAPTRVRPANGVFLEYAPIHRRHDIPYARQIGPKAPDSLDRLDANLKVFPVETARVLEYWLDVSRASKWKRPAAKLPWDRDVFVADLEAYASRGIRHVTTFAAWLDADYVRRHGDPTFLPEYGAGLARAKKD